MPIRTSALDLHDPATKKRQALMRRGLWLYKRILQRFPSVRPPH